IATLQLVDEICRTALRLHDYEMENLSWSEFVHRIDQDTKPELVAYLKSRRLYVNDTTTETEEY
ncbi:MAG: zinc-binding protein, partial [Clostridia bacterium]|nr:zinc-binding protein [Clostridia bacterium]